MILFYLHFFHHFDFLTADKVIFRFSICWFSSKFKLLFIINFEATLSQQIEKRKIDFFVINIPSALTLTLTPPPPSSFPILTISFTKCEKTCYKSRVILIKKSIFFAIRQSASFNFETVHKTPFLTPKMVKNDPSKPPK